MRDLGGLLATLCASIFSLGIVAAAPAEFAVGEPTPVRDARLAEGAVAGTSQAEWTARWWRWAMGQWIAPYLDPDGRWCAIGQNPDSPVWFLAGTDGSFTPKRRCVVPEGKYLLVPVINTYFQGSGAVEADVCAAAQGWVAVNNDQLVSAVAMLDARWSARRRCPGIARAQRWLLPARSRHAIRAVSVRRLLVDDRAAAAWPAHAQHRCQLRA
ncbi:hypothetical protein ABE488_15740 [Luteimonas sp. TWI662]|uniref:hypothetical protein n=1 Tax=Luteimonas sp. TWI662 TaxID=3136789 RepID=UPI0032078B26